ncbi:MAG: hypothetical protein WCE51_05355 [Chthoniobacterales bacterium]
MATIRTFHAQGGQNGKTMPQSAFAGRKAPGRAMNPALKHSFYAEKRDRGDDRALACGALVGRKAGRLQSQPFLHQLEKRNWSVTRDFVETDYPMSGGMTARSCSAASP